MAADYEKQARDLHDAISAHDIEKVFTFYTDDIYFEQVWEGGVVTHGKEEMRSVFKTMYTAFPDYRADLKFCIVSGDRACYEWVMSGTHKGDFRGISPTGKSVSLRVSTVAELRGGKYSRISLYLDAATIMRQLGVLPTTPQK
jgi:steroid delta-isomerase-like uncharacterized protein